MIQPVVKSAFVAPSYTAKSFVGYKVQRRSRTSTSSRPRTITMCEPIVTAIPDFVKLEGTQTPNRLGKLNKPRVSMPRPSFSTSDSYQICIPQVVPLQERVRRKFQISRNREQYQWTYNEISDVALIDSLPPSEHPNRRWVVLMKRVENRCNENKDAVVHLSSCHASMRKESSDPFQRFKDQFAVLDIPKVAEKNDFLRDEIFGWYRVAGPNPMMLQKLDSPVCQCFPSVNNEIFTSVPKFENDSLEVAFSENRLFKVDYSHLSNIESVKYRALSGKEGMYLYSPQALFAVPKQCSAQSPPLPIAIQCDAHSAITHTASKKYTSPALWEAAKLTVQVADAFVHETVFHFARTHLLLEAILCASHRTLADTHPILKLLLCHFEGTAFINDSSLRALICAGGPIDRITAPAIGDTRKFAAKSLVEEFNFSRAMPDREFAARGVDKSIASTLCYPYRDDSLALWKSILEWTKDYVDEFYSSDEDIKADYELQSWCDEVTKNGRIQGFGMNGKILTRKELSRAICMIIFTASVQHAAVNFPQKEMMQFAPAMPLAGYAEVPSSQDDCKEKVGACEQEMIQAMLPGLRQAEEQLRTAELLGVVRYTRLGHYGKRLDFAGEKIKRALSRFQTRLGDLEGKIVSRNYEESNADLVPYSFLKPSQIPQSTNV